MFLCLTTWLLLFVKKSFIEYETTAFIVLENQGQLGLFDAISSLQFLTVPIIYLFKFSLITFMIWIGSFTFGYRITFKDVFGIVTAAEFIFIIPEILKIGYFLFFETNTNYYEIRSFYPLSLMNFMDPTLLADKYHYPAKALNIFEIGYWFFLAHLIHAKARKRLNISYAIVGVFYALLFLLWLLFYVNVYK